MSYEDRLHSFLTAWLFATESYTEPSHADIVHENFGAVRSILYQIGSTIGGDDDVMNDDYTTAAPSEHVFNETPFYDNDGEDGGIQQSANKAIFAFIVGLSIFMACLLGSGLFTCCTYSNLRKNPYHNRSNDQSTTTPAPAYPSIEATPDDDEIAMDSTISVSFGSESENEEGNERNNVKITGIV